jgi:hypothetical protein
VSTINRHAMFSDHARGRMLALLLTAFLALVALPASAQPKRDFDGDGRDDLLTLYWDPWWFSEYSVCKLSTPVATADCMHLAWIWDPQSEEITHTADFHGAGVHDFLLWQTYHGSGVFTVHGAFTPLLEDAGWRPIHVGDFNRDGRADILWYHAASGTTSLWLIGQGLAFGGGAELLANSTWKVTHVADFNGDHKSDLLWRDDATGATAIWLMDGARFVAGAVIQALPAWKAILTGDFDGDGRADIVWHNGTSGETAIWLMNGIAMAAGAIVVANADWAPTHVADLNGDGREDLLWRNKWTLRVHAWLMDGLTMTAGGEINTSGGKVVTTGDYDGDGRADVVLFDYGYANFVQRMNGLSTVGTPIAVPLYGHVVP